MHRHSQQLPFKVQILGSLGEVESLETAWRDLTSEHTAPFQTFSWNMAWYQQFLPEKENLLVFVVMKGQQTVGILPCYNSGNDIRLAGDQSGDFQDLITDRKGLVVEILDKIFETAQTKLSGKRFFFWKILSTGNLASYFKLRELEGRAGMLVHTRFFAPCPYVSIENGLDGYLSSFSSKRRRELGRILRKLDRELPDSQIRMLRHREIQQGDIEKIANFHSEHFRKDGVSPLENRALVKMLVQVAKDPDVGLQLSMLQNQGDIVAVDIGFAKGDRFYGYLTGFDPEYRKLGPGKCLLLKRIDEWVNEDGVKILDFLSGDESYKLGLTAGERHEVHSVYWSPNQLSNQFRHGYFRIIDFGKQILKQLLADEHQHKPWQVCLKNGQVSLFSRLLK